MFDFLTPCIQDIVIDKLIQDKIERLEESLDDLKLKIEDDMCDYNVFATIAVDPHYYNRLQEFNMFCIKYEEFERQVINNIGKVSPLSYLDSIGNDEYKFKIVYHHYTKFYTTACKYIEDRFKVMEYILNTGDSYDPKNDLQMLANTKRIFSGDTYSEWMADRDSKYMWDIVIKSDIDYDRPLYYDDEYYSDVDY
eukprot:704474-Hanusia_phi.AAC.1